VTTRALDLALLPPLDVPAAGEGVGWISAFKTNWLAFAPLTSPGLLGNPTAPTPPPGDSDTSIATTAFVQAAVIGGTSGVATFNARTGAVVLTALDVTSVVPSSAAPPVMDGVAAPGVATSWSRGDHVHPSDTSRYAATNPSGYQTAPQVAAAIVARAASTDPLMDGTAAAGVATTWARADHVHPSDTGATFDCGTF
jgi:hypothetical protein